MKTDRQDVGDVNLWMSTQTWRCCWWLSRFPVSIFRIFFSGSGSGSVAATEEEEERRAHHKAGKKCIATRREGDIDWLTKCTYHQYQNLNTFTLAANWGKRRSRLHLMEPSFEKFSRMLNIFRCPRVLLLMLQFNCCCHNVTIPKSIFITSWSARRVDSHNAFA